MRMSVNCWQQVHFFYLSHNYSVIFFTPSFLLFSADNMLARARVDDSAVCIVQRARGICRVRASQAHFHMSSRTRPVILLLFTYYTLLSPRLLFLINFYRFIWGKKTENENANGVFLTSSHCHVSGARNNRNGRRFRRTRNVWKRNRFRYLTITAVQANYREVGGGEGKCNF